MDKLPTGEARWELVFTENGTLHQPDRESFFDELAGFEVEDLFVFSHGWNNDARAARELYDDMFPRIRDACAGVDTLSKIGFAGVLWPAVWFPETPAYVSTPEASGQVQVGVQGDDASGSDALTGDEITAALLPSFTIESDRESIREIGRLIDQGIEALATGALNETEQRQLIRDIHQRARSLARAGADTAVEDSGEYTLFSDDSPTQTYQGVADTFGTTPPGEDIEGLGDWFRTALEGSKDMVRILSYTIMKARAGKIGSDGLGGLLAEFRRRAPDVRVHLIGHSFGARLVSFALSTVGEPHTSPVASLLLIQGAFSHFSFSDEKQNPFGKPGALQTYADRVRGPLVSTFSVFDYAVYRWYPKASFLSRQDTEDVEEATRWGGMGADGFQAVEPLEPLSLRADHPTSFAFRAGTYYRVDAACVINDVDQSAFAGAHSDIRKAPVAELAAAVAGAHAFPTPQSP